MSLWDKGAEKVLQLVEEIHQMKVRIDGVDRETHRVVEEFKRLIDKFEAKMDSQFSEYRTRQEALSGRLDKLEAKVEATLAHASVVSARDGAKGAAKEAIRDAMTARFSGVPGVGAAGALTEPKDE